MTGVYKLMHPSGVYYIGQTIDFQRRQWQHNGYLRRHVHPSSKLQEAFDVVPEISWEFYPTTDAAEAMALEEYMLDVAAQDTNLANTQVKGNITELVRLCTGNKQSQETILKRVDKTRGMKRTDEFKERLSDNHKSNPAIATNMNRLHETAKRPVKVNDRSYPSVKDAAHGESIHPSTVIQRINSHSDRFNGWTYE